MTIRKLKDIYEASVDDLTASTIGGFPNTKKRQNATNTVTINNIQFIPYEQSNTLQINAKANSSGNNYQMNMMFSDVQYEPNDSPDVTSFKGMDNQEHHIHSVSAVLNDAQVRCTCLDFYYRFANQNYQKGSLFGAAPTPYQRKTTTRPAANPTNAIGMCKHLIKMSDILKDMKILTD
jgi:hypothetical protein